MIIWIRILIKMIKNYWNIKSKTYHDNPKKWRSQVFFNIRKSINIMHQIKMSNGKNLIKITKDRKTKKFDKIRSLLLVLKFPNKLSIEAYFLKMI